MRLKAVLYYAAVAAAVAAALVVTLRLWERRMEVPFGYEGDALFFTVLTKASAQDGPLHFRHLGMPFGVEIADWGRGHAVRLHRPCALWRPPSGSRGRHSTPGGSSRSWPPASSRRSRSARSTSNRPSPSASAICTRSHPTRSTATSATSRSSTTSSPSIALLAIRTAEGRPERLSRGARAAVLLGCAAQGLSYIYYSFFSCVLLGAAALLGWAADAAPRDRSSWPLRASPRRGRHRRRPRPQPALLA